MAETSRGCARLHGGSADPPSLGPIDYATEIAPLLQAKWPVELKEPNAILTFPAPVKAGWRTSRVVRGFVALANFCSSPLSIPQTRTAFAPCARTGCCR